MSEPAQQRRKDLCNPAECLEFLQTCLLLSRSSELESLASRISALESTRPRDLSQGTLFHRRVRKQGYSSTAARTSLRRKVVEELIQQRRLEHDDEMQLGASGGGALPRTELQYTKYACVVLGAPASGKSSISATLADKHGAVVLDADFAKRKLPEYENGLGANLLHAESSELVFGPGGLFEWAGDSEINIVSVMVGRDAKKIKVHLADLTALGYTVRLVTTLIDPAETTRRALARFERTGRYVPLGYVFYDVGRTPEVTFRTLLREGSVEHYGAIDTNGTSASSFWSDCSGICGESGLRCHCARHQGPLKEVKPQSSQKVPP